MRDCAKDSVKELAEKLDKLSSRVHEAKDHGSPADTELVNVLANLDINPGEAADEAAIQAATVWATLEDQGDVVEAVRLNAVDEMTEQLNGTYVEERGVSDDEKEESDGESTGCGGIALPPYAQLSQYFGPLERAAEESGNREAVFYLQKAKITMIKAHASKPVRQSNIRASMQA